MKYLMIFALVCGLGLAATAEAKEVPVAPARVPVAPAKEVWVPPVEEVADEVDIKIGGAVRVRHLNWSDMFFGASTGTGIENEAWLETRNRLLMEADLANDVTVVARLSNERAWGGPVAGEFDVLLDWAYITMANVAGQPIDLIIGRQPIALGDSMQIDDDFDAVRLSIPFEPVVVDAFFAKIEDAEISPPTMRSDDDLMGFHVVYEHPEPAITVNMGYYELIDRATAPVVVDERIRSMAISGSGNLLGLVGDIPGIGGLGIGDLGLLVSGGMIFQTGDVTIRGTSVGLDADALYFEIGAAMDMGAVSLRWASLSGDDPATPRTDEAFRPMFKDVDFGTVILNEIKDDAFLAARVGALNTNLNLWGLGFKASPMPGVGVSLNYIDFTRDAVAPRASDNVGTELNFGVEYALTEDVTLDFTMGRFAPGAALAALGTKTAHLTRIGAELSF